MTTNPANPAAALAQRDQQLVQIVDAAFADSARRAGEHLFCHPGCTQCCHGAFAINPLDALRLRTAMAVLRTENPAQAAILTTRAQNYLLEFGHDFPGDRETGILGITPEEQSAFEDFANEAPCPALNPETGLCDLYEARPMTCRIFGPPVRTPAPANDETGAENDDESNEETGLAVCELCFTTATPEEIATAEMTVPWAEEQSLLEYLQAAQTAAPAGETIVAWCLLPPQPTAA